MRYASGDSRYGGVRQRSRTSEASHSSLASRALGTRPRSGRFIDSEVKRSSSPKTSSIRHDSESRRRNGDRTHRSRVSVSVGGSLTRTRTHIRRRCSCGRSFLWTLRRPESGNLTGRCSTQIRDRPRTRPAWTSLTLSAAEHLVEDLWFTVIGSEVATFGPHVKVPVGQGSDEPFCGTERCVAIGCRVPPSDTWADPV